jgi:hypothetical protein
MPPKTINNFFSPVSTDIAHQNIDELIAINTLQEAGSISAADPLWNKYLQGAEAVGDWMLEMFPPSPGVKPGTPEYGQAQENIRSMFGLIPQEKWEVPFLAAGMFPKGLRKGLLPTKKSLDLTRAEAWSTYPKGWPKTGRGVKAYHSTPYKPIESDLKPGVHVGSPGASIDRLSKKLNWTPELGDVSSGFMHGIEMYPKKPFTRLSPDFEDVVRDVMGWGRYQLTPEAAMAQIKNPAQATTYYPKTRLDDVEEYLDDVRGFAKMAKADPERHTFPALLDELGDDFPADIDREFLDLLNIPRNRKVLTDLGYDVVPYKNAYEGMGSISFNVLNPEKARLKLIDEVYTLEREVPRTTFGHQFEIEGHPTSSIVTLEDLVKATTVP